MTYQFEIVRKPVDKLPNGLLVTRIADDGTVVYSGEISAATRETARIVRNHLAMRSHADRNGDEVSDTKTFNYWVRWTSKKPTGRHAKEFANLNRYSWFSNPPRQMDDEELYGR